MANEIKYLRSFALKNDLKEISKVFTEFSITMNVAPQVPLHIGDARVIIDGTEYDFKIMDPTKNIILEQMIFGIWHLSLRHDFAPPPGVVRSGIPAAASDLSDFTFSFQITIDNLVPPETYLDITVPVHPIPC